MTDKNNPITSIIEQFLSGNFSDLVTSYWHKSQKDAIFTKFPNDLSPLLEKYLEFAGIENLYAHQSKSYKAIREKKNIIIATGTSSGKTLCYNLPVLDALIKNRDITALYLFPTKALTEDQSIKINEIIQFVSRDSSFGESRIIKTGIYDGDTKTSRRISMRNAISILLTNPDMLHIGLLPHHASWESFFRQLRFVVIDEAHTYRGIFGSHIANVIRRLKRILSFYESQPQFILSSATINNPIDLAKKIVEEEFELIDEDGSPQPDRHYFFINPPVINAELGMRRSLIDQSIDLAQLLLQYSVQTIFFARSRKTVEFTLKQLQEILSDERQPEINGYRSGYLARERREIESGLREGLISTIISTNALELGIDMGGVDAVVLMGYPGSIASFMQQSGRAGRRHRPSLSLLIASSSPIDQYIIRHPEFIQGKNPESALVDPDNALLLLNHLRCALYELPFEENEGFGRLSPTIIKPYLDALVQLSQASQRSKLYYWMSDQYPSQSVSLRNISGHAISLILEGTNSREVIGEVDFQNASRTVHPGAIYFHNGENFYVKELNFDDCEALLRKQDSAYFTEPINSSQVEFLDLLKQKSYQNYSLDFSEVRVIQSVVGYKKIDWQTREILNQYELEMPEVELVTCGLVLKFSEDMITQIRALQKWDNDANYYGSDWNIIRDSILKRDQFRCQVCGHEFSSSNLHVHHKIPFRRFRNKQEANQEKNLTTLCFCCHKAAEQNLRMRSGLSGFAFLFSHISSLFLMCDQHDIGYFVDPISRYNRKLPLVCIYDQYPGGIGLSADLFNKTDQVIKSCLDVILACDCKDGCPACIGPAGENGIGGKEATLELIKRLF